MTYEQRFSAHSLATIRSFRGQSLHVPLTLHSGLLFAAAVCLLCLTAGYALADAGAADQPDIDARVAKFVEQLGAEQFTVRENAQSELQRLGLAAFDALDQARHHDDVEVAMRARYLLRVMSFDWSRGSDSPEVKGALRGYGEQREEERRSRMERLSALENSRGIPALCRLARFETSQLLSKRAVLLIMHTTPPADAAERAELAKVVRTTADSSKRPAAAWLRLYAQTLEAPLATIDGWQKLALAELQAMRGSSDKSDPEIVRDLLRWQSDFLRQNNRPEESLAVARRIVDITEGSPTELSDLVGWLMERESWSLVQEVAERHADGFSRSAILAYRHAEALQRQKETEAAEKIAERAWRMQPDNSAAHLEVAIELRDRGLFAWAEREFRSAIKIGQPGDQDDVKARFRLSEMQFDYRQPLEAAKTWQELVDLMKTNPEVRTRYGQRKQFFQSRMHYFYADHYAALNDRARQEEHLKLGIEQDETDADVLITMHRLPNSSDDWKQQTSRRITAAAALFKEQIQQWSRVAEQQLEPEQREQVHETLANMCNQYAWLVGNTEGDKDEALRCGHRAVELMPKTGSYLDTLAHCYYAKHDYANAVKYQTVAVQREPHSLQIRRQLDVFRKALAEQQGEPKPSLKSAPTTSKPDGSK